MLNEKILVIGGTFNESGGIPSSFVENIFSKIEGAMIINGGLIDFLENFIKEGIKDYNIVFWLPENIEGLKNSFSDIKKLNKKCLIIEKTENKDLSNIDIAKYLADKKANLMLKIFEDSKTIQAISVATEIIFEKEVSENFIENILEENIIKKVLDAKPYEEPEPVLTLERLHLRIVNDTIDILYRPSHDYLEFVTNDNKGKAIVKKFAEMSREEFEKYLKTKTGKPKLTKESVLNLKTTKAEEWYLGAWKTHTDKIFKELGIENPVEEPIWNY